MSERTGLDPLEEAVLLTLDELGAQNDRPHVKSARVLMAMERRFGYGPRYAYEMLCDLVRPWTVQLPLVDGHGNFSAPDAFADGARYNECRLSSAGTLALAAERAVLPPLPIALINGTHFKGGVRPSFEPERVVAGLIRLLTDEGISNEGLIEVVGSPAFPTGCAVRGDIDRLIEGRSATLSLTAVTREGGEGGATVLDVSNLPPGMTSSHVVDNIAARVNQDIEGDELEARTAIALREVKDLSTPQQTKIRCVLAPDADSGAIADRLREIWGVTIEVVAQLPAPLPELYRSWARDHATDGTVDALAQLREVLPIRSN